MSFINTIDSLGDAIVLKSIIEKTIIEYKDNALTLVGAYAFQGCLSLQIVDLPSVTQVYSSAFQGCSALSEINIPSAIKIGDRCLYDCKQLSSIDIPLVTEIGSSAFASCTKLTKVNLPSVTNIKQTAFDYCSGLTIVDLPVIQLININAFRYNSNLIALIIRSGAVCELNGTNALTGTPIASGTGYIYVPSALIEDYKVATNWSTYANQFRALEDYTVDGTITGELDESKI